MLQCNIYIFNGFFFIYYFKWETKKNTKNKVNVEYISVSICLRQIIFEIVGK